MAIPFIIGGIVLAAAGLAIAGSNSSSSSDDENRARRDAEKKREEDEEDAILDQDIKKIQHCLDLLNEKYGFTEGEALSFLDGESSDGYVRIELREKCEDLKKEKIRLKKVLKYLKDIENEF
ncbi:MAG: hypothetical protein COB58_00280 [Thalassobium sp.]|nr:MAG: hypothetical protein COB58_12355 [Thalassobium sp.]PHQ88294.1 MAG: hypothetical protein COB58_00280 [Thalassobium sp.]